ncbi:uncharacterized protein Z518_03489 [Rhinocladiella mackenziei CBS 650.93]|uniref:Rhinocladiella mackenziei CBS 650.93 unplaced genomic scaffold supercont1.2, whole genome shotgun sequence n=1 Tax=Rhinocladiella mackenziei CBS 650.93 TaxID=1442369 RepID=A0A0D2G2Q4_9EURO|nr:uncharacterized protein Z518_03489 [Rhinocladiella mackenziei CBS 650.93]KIX08832.1 hypothetical protein Z518_03489 [Rhinocladiella mackenziei CBS 650.93]
MPSNEGIGFANRADPFKVLVVGGSYGGLGATLNLLDLCNGRPARFASDPSASHIPSRIPVDITVVDERDGYFHLISSPLALASNEYAPKSWTKFDSIPALKNVRCIRGSVKSVDCKRRQALITETNTQSELTMNYDFLVAGSGLRRVWPVVPQATIREEFLEEVATQVQSLKDSQDGVVVVGGGAVGIEMAAEIKLVMPEQKVTLIHSRDKLCSAEPLPDEFKDRCLTTLHEAGVETIMNQRVLDTETSRRDDGTIVSKLRLANGTTITAGQVIHAISKSSPSTTYLPKAALDEEGYVKVAPSLNFLPDMPNSQYHFAVGDIAKWSGIKRCGAAMHMGQYAAQNIHQLMLKQVQGTKPKFMELDEIPPMIGIAIGKQAVAYYPGDGTTFGEDMMQKLFGDDLGNMICWNYMQLGKEFP